jgi:hypothetical protein
VIYVSKDQLDQVEYLINQSALGNHVLFDAETVRRVFDSPNLYNAVFTEEQAYEVEHHIERLMGQPSLTQKRAYLEALDAETYERVVRTYFNIVENKMYETLEVKH